MSGTFWTVVSDLGARGLALVSTLVIARSLGAHEYGVYTATQAALAAVLTVAPLGLSQAATRYTAVFRASSPDQIEAFARLCIWLSAALGVLWSIAAYSSAAWVRTGIVHGAEIADPLRLISPAIFFNVLAGAMMGVLMGFEAFRKMTKLTWIVAVVTVAAMTAGAVWGGLNGLIWGFVAAEAFRCLCFCRLATLVMRDKGFRLVGPLRLDHFAMLWRFSLPLVLGSMLHAPVIWLCQLIILRHSPDFAELAHYDVGQKWMTVVMIIPIAASAAYLPVLANMHGVATKRRHVTRTLAILQFVATAIPAIGVAYIASWGAGLFGPSFEASAAVIPLTMMLAPIFVLKHLYWQALTSEARTMSSLLTSLVWAMTAIVLAWHWKTDGAIGLTKAMIGAYGIALALSVVLFEWYGDRDGAKLTVPRPLGEHE